MTLKSRENQLRRDARRINMIIQKDAEHDGYMIFDNGSKNAAIVCAAHFETVEECERFIRDCAKDIGAMSDDGKWLVDEDGDLIDE